MFGLDLQKKLTCYVTLPLFDNLSFELVVLRGACDRSVCRQSNTDACGARSMLHFVFRVYLQACPILFRPMMYVYDVTHVKLDY